QVQIDAEIMSVNSSLMKDLGIQWQALYQSLGDGVDVNINFPAQIPNSAPRGSVNVGNLETEDYTALVQALTSDSDTNILASPNVLVRDGEQAQFISARDEPFTVVTVDGNTQTTLEDVRFINV